MWLLDFTLPTPAENLALDEALLDEAEATSGEVLRMWESPQLAVILGRSSCIAQEADLEACRTDGVPIRCSSGGCAVLIGPGCLMYSVVLSYALRPELQHIDEAHRFVLQRVRQALAAQVPTVDLAGTSDLAYLGCKFSGNSLRCKRTHLLYHGTILYDFALSQIGRYLKTPPREPEYRSGRNHGEFVRNLCSIPSSCDLRWPSRLKSRKF